MFFPQAMQAPVVIEAADERISIPKFTLDDFAAWGAELDAQRENRLTSGMDLEKKFHFLSFYNLMPMDVGDMRRMVRTVQGIRYVVGKCLARAKVAATKRDGQWQQENDPKILSDTSREAIIRYCSPRDLERLAIQLADVDDDRVLLREKQEKIEAEQGDGNESFADQKTDEEGRSPLMRTASTASSA